MTAAELSAALAKLGTERPNASVRVFSLAPYTINVEHRAPLAQAASVQRRTSTSSSMWSKARARW
jgi:hypothetical protein